MNLRNGMVPQSTYGKALRTQLYELERKLEKMEEYCKYLAENLDKAISYSEMLAEELNNLIEKK